MHVIAALLIAPTTFTIFANEPAAKEPAAKEPAAKEPAASPSLSLRKGLRFLADDSMAWKKERNCLSCHHAATTVWALREAKQRGHAVDEKVLAELTRWIVESGDGAGRRQKPPANAPRALNTYSLYMSLALAADAKPEPRTRDALAKLRKTLVKEQSAAGDWQAWPDTRPPLFGPSSAAMTALATLALTNGEPLADKALLERRHRAIQWLTTAPPEDDMQGAAISLMAMKRLGRPVADTGPLVKRLIQRQNADGGWSQIPAMASDAHATGQAVFALADAGLDVSHPPLKRGRDFLVKTQRADGGWTMTSRPCPPTNKGGKNLVPINGAGASWGVLGLVRTVAPSTATSPPKVDSKKVDR